MPLVLHAYSSLSAALQRIRHDGIGWIVSNITMAPLFQLVLFGYLDDGFDILSDSMSVAFLSGEAQSAPPE